MEKKKITLTEFVRSCGTQEKAAVAVGVTFSTMNRWFRGRTQPHGLSRQRLEDLNVDLHRAPFAR